MNKVKITLKVIRNITMGLTVTIYPIYHGLVDIPSNISMWRKILGFGLGYMVGTAIASVACLVLFGATTKFLDE